MRVYISTFMCFTYLHVLVVVYTAYVYNRYVHICVRLFAIRNFLYLEVLSKKSWLPILMNELHFQIQSRW